MVLFVVLDDFDADWDGFFGTELSQIVQEFVLEEDGVGGVDSGVVAVDDEGDEFLVFSFLFSGKFFLLFFSLFLFVLFVEFFIGLNDTGVDGEGFRFQVVESLEAADDVGLGVTENDTFVLEELGDPFWVTTR